MLGENTIKRFLGVLAVGLAACGGTDRPELATSFGTRGAENAASVLFEIKTNTSGSASYETIG